MGLAAGPFGARQKPLRVTEFLYPQSQAKLSWVLVGFFYPAISQSCEVLPEEDGLSLTPPAWNMFGLNLSAPGSDLCLFPASASYLHLAAGRGRDAACRNNTCRTRVPAPEPLFGATYSFWIVNLNQLMAR